MAEEQRLEAQKYLVFMVQEKRYALPSDLIGEVAVFERVFPLPLAPDYVRGIINRYSVPYALVDMGLLLLKTPSQSSKILVLKETVDKLAFLIDDVTDFAEIPPEALLKIDTDESGTDTVAIGATFEWKGVLVLLLEIEDLMNRIKQDFA